MKDFFVDQALCRLELAEKMKARAEKALAAATKELIEARREYDEEVKLALKEQREGRKSK